MNGRHHGILGPGRLIGELGNRRDIPIVFRNSFLNVRRGSLRRLGRVRRCGRPRLAPAALRVRRWCGRASNIWLSHLISIIYEDGLDARPIGMVH